MQKHCAANERIKREYLTYLKDAERNSEPTLDGTAKAIARFEVYTRHTDFKKFHIQQAVGFKQKLAAETNLKTGQPLSLATQRATLNTLKAFFKWLAAQSGYKSRFTYADADYFNMSDRDNRAAQASTPRPYPSLEQVQHVIRTMAASTAIQQRDRAMIAFMILTGCRDRALVSLTLKHIDVASSRVNFDAREVKTKFSKSFVTFFMPMGDDIRAIFESWVATLTADHFWGPSDPLFPAPKMEVDGAGGFRAAGLRREHWTTANAVRRIFRTAFDQAGLPYFHPHSFRHTLAQLGEQICRSPEEFKAWSQNFGHEHVMTTFSSYGKVSTPRQAEIIRQLARPAAPAQRDLAELLRQVANRGSAIFGWHAMRHTTDHGRWPGENDRHQLSLLMQLEFWRSADARAVGQSAQAVLVVADDPVAQCLAVHARRPGRVLAAHICATGARPSPPAGW